MTLLELLGNLTIALIAVAISVYAISVSVLSTQLRKNLLYIKRRLSETEIDIREIQESIGSSDQRLSSIEEKLEQFRSEEKDLRDILFCLTLGGAVIRPCISFLVALSLVFIGLLILQHTWIVALASAVCIAYGSYRVYCTLKSVDSAQTNIPLPKFDVTFGGVRSQSLEGGRTHELPIDIENYGYDMGEFIQLSIFFPPDFTVVENDYDVNLQPEHANFLPSYAMVSFDLDILHVDTAYSYDVAITTPSNRQAYKIPVLVNERKIDQEEFELEIVIV